MLGRRTTKSLADGDSLGIPERPPSPSLSVASDLGEPTKRNQGDEELRCVIAVLRHGEWIYWYDIPIESGIYLILLESNVLYRGWGIVQSFVCIKWHLCVESECIFIIHSFSISSAPFSNQPLRTTIFYRMWKISYWKLHFENIYYYLNLSVRDMTAFWIWWYISIFLHIFIYLKEIFILICWCIAA